MLDKAIILYHYLRTLSLSHRLKNRSALEGWQQRRIDHFKRHVLSKSPFYQDYLHRPLSEFPIMTKQRMMENFDTLNTVGIKKVAALELALKAEQSRDFSPMINGITVGLSSGTSGQRGLFLASKAERLTWVGIMLAKALPDSLFTSQRVAFFLRANSNLYTNLTKHDRLQFRFFDLTIPFDRHLNDLGTFAPTIIVAPASTLRFIAEAQSMKKISLAPAKIISVAEVLDALDQRFIESTFGLPVHQIYQATEGFLGISDAQNTLRLNEEFIHIEKEWVDRATGRFIPIITDFTRTSQPIVRYRLDDILIEDLEAPSHPFTQLKAIEGRADDTFQVPDQSGNFVPIFADVLRHIMSSMPLTLEDYRLIQHNPKAIEIQISPLPSSQEQELIKQRFVSLLASLACEIPELTVTDYQPNPLDKKLKRIERRFALKEFP